MKLLLVFGVLHCPSLFHTTSSEFRSVLICFLTYTEEPLSGCTICTDLPVLQKWGNSWQEEEDSRPRGSQNYCKIAFEGLDSLLDYYSKKILPLIKSLKFLFQILQPLEYSMFHSGEFQE